MSEVFRIIFIAGTSYTFIGLYASFIGHRNLLFDIISIFCAYIIITSLYKDRNGIKKLSKLETTHNKSGLGNKRIKENSSHSFLESPDYNQTLNFIKGSRIGSFSGHDIFDYIKIEKNNTTYYYNGIYYKNQNKKYNKFVILNGIIYVPKK